ncbi:MAG: Lipolytic protein family [Verrucomicrobiales bacterium]|nr:Lipolytic protein family [Verrucomicrobiales bacterium]MDB6131576.1 Lipolytic protein family [Verrucomicrobiales bacterium]
MKKVLILLGVIAIAVAVYFFFSREHWTNYPAKNAGPWVAFGDSLTAGFGADQGHDYPTILGQRLSVKMVNKGVPGETSADGLARIGQVKELHPRVVLVCFGGNDTLNHVPFDTTFSNIGQIIDQLQADGAFVVLVGVPSASIRDKYEKRFKSLAKEKQTLFIPDILKGVLGTPNLMSDYVHPNDEGYKKIAERFDDLLLPYLHNL